jgi:hypothetical protein
MSNLNMPDRVLILKEKFTNSFGLPFRELLPESKIQEFLDLLEIKFRRRVFDPVVIVWAFLSQVLDPDKSCHNAVSRIISWLASENVELPSPDTGAYCQAIKRLPEKLLALLFSSVANSLEDKVTSEQFWCGRHIKVIDGSTVSMPDTLENQEAYPQPSSQKPGCGFPLAKIGVLFSLLTGAATALVIDTLNVHDIKFARKLYEFLNPGDILVGDRAFCSYSDFIFINYRQADAVFRKNQSRDNSERRRDKRVGPNDKLVTWYKPKACPKGLSKEEFTALPKTLVLREVQYYIAITGYRTKHVKLITTLTDASKYPMTELMNLYESRWDVEVNFKHLKTTLGMEILRSKTPEMVRKEIYTFLLAYNLLRTLMWEAGINYGVPPLALSLQGTRHHLDNFIPQLVAATSEERPRIYLALQAMIIHKVVPERIGRVSPRVRKRRPKSYPLMQQPRSVLCQKLA